MPAHLSALEPKGVEGRLTTKDLTRRTNYSLADLKGIAQAFAASGYFKDARDAAQAFTKILAGQELGIPPMQAMTGYHIVEGKPAPSATLIGALIKRSGKYDYTIMVLTDEECSLGFYQDGELIGESHFTLADAKVAGLVRGGSGWTKFPRNMLFARALTNGARWFCPDVFGGPVYTPEELGADLDGEGDPVLAEAVLLPADESDKPYATSEGEEITDEIIESLTDEDWASAEVGGVRPSLADGVAPPRDSEPVVAEDPVMPTAAVVDPPAAGSEKPARKPEPRCSCGHALRSHPEHGACKVKGCECAEFERAATGEDSAVGDTDEAPPAPPRSFVPPVGVQVEAVGDLIARFIAEGWLTREQMNGAMMKEFGTTDLTKLNRPQLSDLKERLEGYEKTMVGDDAA